MRALYRMDVFGWILLIGFCTLLAIAIFRWNWEPEGFQNMPPRTDDGALAWVLSDTDHKARAGNSCKVLAQFADTEISDAVIQIVEDSCESGLPHTVDPNTIRISQRVWDQGDARRQNILRHERIHLLQRREPSLWEGFYKTEWQYTVTQDPPQGIDSSEIRANPDTYPARWACWKNRYWFVPVYKNVTAPRIPETNTRIWDATTRAWLEEPPLEWRTTFCNDEDGKCPYQSEHPAEISAEYATEMQHWKTPAALALQRFLAQI